MKLEEIIRARQVDFEESPGPANWEKIKRQLPDNSKRVFWLQSRFKVFAGAAVVLCCVGLAYLFGIKKGQHEGSMANMPQMAQENAEFVSFSKNIEEKKAVFSKLVSDQPVLEEAFSRDLETLETDYQALKMQIQTSPNKELILRAMIENLKYQEQILIVQTRILEKTEQKPRIDLL